MANPPSPTSVFTRLKAARRLPSPPGTALRVLQLCRREDVRLQEIADVLMADPALSSRLVKFANSPIAGIANEVTSIRAALLLLGLRVVKLTALGFSLISPDAQIVCRRFDARRFWRESFAAAVIARRLAGDFIDADREEAFTAALLSQLGQLALAQGMPEEYEQVLERRAAGQRLEQAERDVLHTDYAEFGAQLLGDWSLPSLLVGAVRHQLAPANDRGPSRTLSVVVHWARELAGLFSADGQMPPQEQAQVQKSARHVIATELKIDATRWAAIADELMQSYREVASVFNVQLDSGARVMELYAEAQEEATRVGVAAQLETIRTQRDNEALLRRATTDPLTGVYNRTKLKERLEEMLRLAHRSHGRFGVVLFDIDRFKLVNDRHGHIAGDAVLVQVARAASAIVREVDLLARYGGEEFVILAADADGAAACVLAERVRQCIEHLAITHDNTELKVTVSLGVCATADFAAVPNARGLLAEADHQLYLAKGAGRNICMYRGERVGAPKTIAVPG